MVCSCGDQRLDRMWLARMAILLGAHTLLTDPRPCSDHMLNLQLHTEIAGGIYGLPKWSTSSEEKHFREHLACCPDDAVARRSARRSEVDKAAEREADQVAAEVAMPTERTRRRHRRRHRNTRTNTSTAAVVVVILI